MFLSVTFITTSIYVVKMATLFFSRSLFFVPTASCYQKFQNVSLVVMGFATAWFVETQIGNLTLYQPLHRMWTLIY
jgi:hypothetical protein